MEFEDDLTGLPSVGLDSSAKELFETYIAVQDIRHKSPETSPFGVHFKTFYHLHIALALRLANQKDVSSALENLLREENPQDLMDVARFWATLPDEMPGLNLNTEDALISWVNGIEKTTNIYKATLNYAYILNFKKQKNNEIQEEEIRKLEEYIETVVKSLPDYDSFQNLDSNVIFAIGLSTTVKAIGLKSPELEEYLIGALPNIEFAKVEAHIVSALLDFVCKSDIDSEIKLTRILSVKQFADRLQDGFEKEALTSACVKAYLDLGMFEKAKQTWITGESNSGFFDSISYLSEYAMKNGLQDKLRGELPELLKKLMTGYEGNEKLLSFYKNNWNREWYFAAYFLTKKGEYHMDEPEIIELISSGGIDFSLAPVAEIAVKNKDRKIFETVKKRIEELVKDYNLGRLDGMKASQMLHALMVFKSDELI